MARSRKKNIVKRIAIVGLVLIAVQAVIIFSFKTKPPVPIKQKIDEEVDARGDITPHRKAQMKIQLALADYRDKHGKFPANLSELIPDYFDSVPLDPDNNQPFPYALNDKGKYTLGDDKPTAVAKSGEGASGSAALLAALDKDDQTAFVYNPQGKRDPFRPFTFTPTLTEGAELRTPLEGYAIGELKLTAILDGFEQPYAMVENTNGKGFKIQKGTKIGNNGGVVVEIKKDRVLILETTIDFTGEKKTKTVEMRLRAIEKNQR